MTDDSPRWAGLDGLRAIAVLLVLWLHACYAGYLTAPWWFPYSGRLGVSLFFVLSGYLITRLLLQEAERHGRIDLKKFYIRRCLRIFPPYYLYLLVLVLIPFLGARPTDPIGLLLAASYCLNLTSAHRDHNIEHTWSLCYEEQYYLFWPAALLLLGKRRATFLALGVVVGWPILRILKAGHLAFSPALMLQSTAFDTLMMGSSLALLTADQRPGRRTALTMLAAVGLILGMYAGQAFIPESLAVLIPTVRDLCLAWIVWWCVSNPGHPLVRVLDTPWMVGLGAISYSLYLWHPLFLQAHDGPLPHGWQSWVAVGLATMLSYRLVEVPLQRWRARWRPA
ncbi:MAG: acyltransferase [Candidatus Xenobia bacterium]